MVMKSWRKRRPKNHVSTAVSGVALGAVSSNMCLTNNYVVNGARTVLADHVSVVAYTGSRKDVKFLFFNPPDKNHVLWTPNARVSIEPGTGWIRVAEKILAEVFSFHFQSLMNFTNYY